MQGFSWERGPFEKCPACQKITLGILSAGGDSLTLRCKECRYSLSEILPEVEKRVIYLDQNLFSLLFKVETGGRLPSGHEEFTRELYRKLRRVVLLQQAILPHSDIHLDETIVFHSANDLRAAYERLGGDARLSDVSIVEQKQSAEYAKAFIKQEEPVLSFGVDEVLESKRNVWLRDMLVQVNTDYGIFADGIREHRDRFHEGMRGLVEDWATRRPTLEQVLDAELRTFFNRPQALLSAVNDYRRAAESGNPMGLLEASHHPILREHEMLSSIFLKAGLAKADVGKEVYRFWTWERNMEQPHHRISSYIFAALAKRVVNGKKRVNRGMMNDVRAISIYAPYVDAMFIDKECADLLTEPKLVADLNYKARIFSFANPDAFLSYISELEANTSDAVRVRAARIYGIS